MWRRRSDEVRPQGVHAGADAAPDDRRGRVRQEAKVKHLRDLTHSPATSLG